MISLQSRFFICLSKNVHAIPYWTKQLFIFLFLFPGTCVVYSQCPVSLYDDKCGSWANDKPSNPFAGRDPVRGSEVGMSCLKIYKDRENSKVESALKLKETTTLVVVDNEESDYGKAIKKAFQEYWKYTPYKFITTQEVVNFAGKKDYSFFMFARDEHYEATIVNQQGIGYAHGMPTIYYKSDSMRHKPKTGLLASNSGEYMSTYVFMIALSDEKGVEDSTEENVTSNFSVADYIVPFKSNTDASYKYAGSLAQNRINAIYLLDGTVKNIEKDLEYMYGKKRDKMGNIETKKYTMQYMGCKFNFNMDIIAYEGGDRTWKDKTLFVNNKICDNLGRTIIAGLLGLDNKNVELVQKAFIDSVVKAGDNDKLIIWDIDADEAGDYKISSIDGTELIGINEQNAQKIFRGKRGVQVSYQPKKCELLYNNNVSKFIFYVAYYCDINALKDKVLYANNEFTDELARGIMARILQIDDINVKLVSKRTTDSIVAKGGSNCMLFLNNSADDNKNYIISTPDGVQIIGINKWGASKEIGLLDLIGPQQFIYRKAFSVK
jgi:hypothetical protein